MIRSAEIEKAATALLEPLAVKSTLTWQKEIEDFVQKADALRAALALPRHMETDLQKAIEFGEGWEETAEDALREVSRLSEIIVKLANAVSAHLDRCEHSEALRDVLEACPQNLLAGPTMWTRHKGESDA